MNPKIYNITKTKYGHKITTNHRNHNNEVESKGKQKSCPKRENKLIHISNLLLSSHLSKSPYNNFNTKHKSTTKTISNNNY